MGKKLSDYDWGSPPGEPIPNYHSNIIQVKDLLNTTGPGFCLAKFKQVTLHLGAGTVHSCHHPSVHQIDKDAVGMDANVLFNTPELKQARKEMLTGERPAECDFCWRVEDSDNADNNMLSDRHMKSSEPWALQHHDIISNSTGDEDVYPSYLEVDFSNVCNLRCTYCGPEFSSKWVDDIKKNGPLKILDGTRFAQRVQGWQNLDTLAYKNREHNPYIDAFWKWFPEAYKHLEHYRITGGEPLLSKETIKSIDWLIENPNPELEFSINSNLSVPDVLWDNFIEKIVKLRDANSVKRITIFTSVEGWGKRAEYGRTGLDFELFKRRYEQVVALGNIRGVIMSTFNIFSITSYQQLLEWVLELKKKYNSNKSMVYLEKDTGFKLPTTGKSFTERSINDYSHVVGIDVPYLRNPTFLDARICTADLVDDFWIPAMNFMAANNTSNKWALHQGFEDHEYDKFYRNIIHRLYFNKKSPDGEEEHNHQTTLQRAKFYDFIITKDARDNTNFAETFPEMANFYNVCKQAFDRINTTRHHRRQ